MYDDHGRLIGKYAVDFLAVFALLTPYHRRQTSLQLSERSIDVRY